MTDEKDEVWPPVFKPEPTSFETVSESQSGNAKNAILGSGGPSEEG